MKKQQALRRAIELQKVLDVPLGHRNLLPPKRPNPQMIVWFVDQTFKIKEPQSQELRTDNNLLSGIIVGETALDISKIVMS
mmetsp:Transcript_14369/g.16476  ORF Transcript_14369/g.16476 Transcript_14369/m.16476 type:complete len:81 (-) Transcript_14369:160-402(-)